MTTIDTTYKSPRGTPVFEQMDTFVQSNLIAGVEPARQQPVRILLASSLTLARFTVVGLDASNHIVKAVYNADPASAIKPIGVLERAATSAASNTTIYGEVCLTGCYNVGDDDAGTGSPLVWDASFDTAAKKIASVVANALLIFRRGKSV